MSYSNRYLNDFLPVFEQILREKHISPETLHLEVIDEEDGEKSLFEKVGVVEVLSQLADRLNFLTIYTDRPEYFEVFAGNCFRENGLMPVFFPKRKIGKATRMENHNGTTLVLDFEWEGACYFSVLAQKKNYIPIHKKPWKIAENLDIIVPFGYNTVIVKSRQMKKKKPVRDRFEKAFYSSE